VFCYICFLNKSPYMESNVQYLMDEKGDRTAALVPIEQWEKLLEFYESYSEIGDSIKRGFKDVRAIKSGQQIPKSISTFLDDL
ncbi:MAG: hypothetical protein AAGG68_31355, partial [Bacteroidota bacterium]